MCGIAGIVTSDGRPGEARAVVAMCDRLTHRGPDDHGLYEATDVCLGARRLSIVDVEGGHQPMSSDDGSMTVIQNGEIYNFFELRAELEALGFVFRTKCDTEALLHGYRAWGEGLIERLNGMFAFALWDREQRSILIARDRMGIKPLLYAVEDGRLVFASELKALLVAPGVSRDLDVTALRDYLVYEYVPTPRTIITGVRRLPPGHLAVFRDGLLRVRQYWDLALREDDEWRGAGVDALAAELRTRLNRAIQLELLSDVPIGVLLSGGLDSSTIAATMVGLGVNPVRSFSVGFRDPSFDESRYANRVAGYLGTEHHQLMVEPSDVEPVLSNLASIVDEPLGDSSIVPTYLLSRFARERVTVALGGEGGDEVFGGYPTLQAHQVAAWVERAPPVLQRALERVARCLPSDSANISFDFKVKRFLAGLRYPSAIRHHIWMGSLEPADATRLLQRDVRDSVDGVSAMDAIAEHLAALGRASRIDEILYLDTKMYLENDILVKTDRASMACSLETRVPLLNRVLVEFMSGLPTSMKVRGVETKYLLKRAMVGVLPPDIIDRRKKGFNFPVAAALRTTLRPMMLDLLSTDHVRRQGLFDAALVERLVGDHLTGKVDNRKPLWTLLVFQLWHAALGGAAAPTSPGLERVRA